MQKRVREIDIGDTPPVAPDLAAASTGLAMEVPTFSPAESTCAIFGARGNGKNNDTASINAAIEKCSSGGGGTVLFPAGVYSAASIHLRSMCRLLLDAEAVIAGAPTGTISRSQILSTDSGFRSQPFSQRTVMGRKHRGNFAIIATHRWQSFGGGRCSNRERATKLSP